MLSVLICPYFCSHSIKFVELFAAGPTRRNHILARSRTEVACGPSGTLNKASNMALLLFAALDGDYLHSSREINVKSPMLGASIAMYVAYLLTR